MAQGASAPESNPSTPSTTLSSTPCHKCDNNFENIIKCFYCISENGKECKLQVCYPCSGLPLLNFINFKDTESRYRCNDCTKQNLIKKGKDIEGTTTSIMAELNRTETTPDNMNDRSSNCENNDNHTVLLSIPPEMTATNQAAQHQADQTGLENTRMYHRNTTHTNNDLNGKIICKYWLRGRCSKRDTCTFTHPKLCKKFMKGRNDPHYGCNNNTNTMNHFHPRVCYNFEDYGSCEKADYGSCRYFHRNICRNMYQNEEYENHLDSRNIEHGQRDNQPNHSNNYLSPWQYNITSPSHPHQFPPAPPTHSHVNRKTSSPHQRPVPPHTFPPPPPPTHSHEHFPALGRRKNHPRQRNSIEFTEGARQDQTPPSSPRT